MTEPVGSGGEGASSAGHVRPALASDLGELVALWIALAGHHAALDPQHRLRRDAAPGVARLLEDQLSDDRAGVFVWELEGRLAGLCAARIERAPAVLVETQRAELTELVVRREARRRGIGRALAEAALEWVAARGVERVEVRVAAANAEGQAFWRALGFGVHMDVLQRRL